MDNTIYTAGTLLEIMNNAFKQHNMEQASAEAVAILAELLNCNRVQAQVDTDRPLDKKTFEQGLEIIHRRLHNEPWQYIFQRAYFRDLTLHVTSAVLIPRPETELLVDWCLDVLPEHGSLLDMGTGSGAIALAVATERPDICVTACDVSPDALKIAALNGKRIAPERVKWLQSDLFSALPTDKFDVIAGNLPYVTESEYALLSPEVRDFEPKLALTSGEDGLDLIRRVITEASEHLNIHGSIILEMSEPQTATAAELFSRHNCWSAIEILQDYTRRNRFVTARLR